MGSKVFTAIALFCISVSAQATQISFNSDEAYVLFDEGEVLKTWNGLDPSITPPPITLERLAGVLEFDHDSFSCGTAVGSNACTANGLKLTIDANDSLSFGSEIASSVRFTYSVSRTNPASNYLYVNFTIDSSMTAGTDWDYWQFPSINAEEDKYLNLAVRFSHASLNPDGSWSGVEVGQETSMWVQADYDTDVDVDGCSYCAQEIVRSTYQWAAHGGAVTSVVPLPPAVWLFGSGLLALLRYRRSG
jgi:hypothetical protein